MNISLKLCVFALLVCGALADWTPAHFSCGTGNYGISCGAGKTLLQQLSCDQDKNIYCNKACGKTVIVNQLGNWAAINETLTAVNMNYPLTLTYQQVPGAPVWTLQLATDSSASTLPGRFRLIPTAAGGTVQFDPSWSTRPDGTKKHMVAWALYSIAGQCFSEDNPGGLGFSWTRKWIKQPADNMMSSSRYDAIMANQYSSFFVSVDQQYSVQECMALGGNNRKVGGPDGNINNQQFLTFKPTLIRVYFKPSGPGFQGLVLSRSDNSLTVPQNLVTTGLNFWDAPLADNEYITSFRYNTGPNTIEVTCVGFGITDLDGKYRDYGGCSDFTIPNPYSWAWNYAGTWMATMKC